MRDYLNKIIKAKETRAAELRDLIQKSNDVNEVRALGETLQSVLDELSEARQKLAELDQQDDGDGGEPMGDGEGRSAQIVTPAFNPVASYGMNNNGMTARNDDPLSTMEYRKAFMEYVQRGTPNQILKRADAEGVSSDLGILLPNTIVQEIIKGVEKVYGQLYSRVKKTNVKGGVQYPIGAFSANLVWGGTSGTDTEHGVSEKQKAGGATGYVQFTYHIGEIRIAQSLLQSVLSVDIFEAEITKSLIEAYVKAMDVAITDGTGNNQPTGIFANTSEGIQRIPAENIVTFTAADMADWTKWQKNLFAKIPLSMRAMPAQFVMTANTFESNIMTLADDNNRPLYRETYNPVTGEETATFKGKEVVFVEEGTSIKNFDDATDGEYFGIYWVPEKAYAINTNMQFGYKKYFDENTNQYITKALVIVDGKILDPKYIYLLKKVTA